MVLGLPGIALVVAPEWAPLGVGAVLASAAGPLVGAWRTTRGTALRSAVAWGFLAVGLGLTTQGVAFSEPLATGRPGAGHWAYLTALAGLAAAISVLNARRPGETAWAILMALLVLVLLVPWVEGAGLAGGASGWSRLRLEWPWSWFFALLAFAGVTNYLPTRFGWAAAWVGLGLGIEFLALARTSWPLRVRGACWSAGPWALAVAAWVAAGSARRGGRGEPGLERLWLWFRDRWGVVWALRVQERFHQSARAQGWPIRLAWFGVVPAEGTATAVEVPEAAEATFRELLRRFADAATLEAATGRAAGGPCQPPAPS